MVDLPEIGSLVYMQVTHVQSPKNICMRNIDGDNEKILLSMEDDMSDWMKSKRRPMTNVQVIAGLKSKRRPMTNVQVIAGLKSKR